MGSRMGYPVVVRADGRLEGSRLMPIEQSYTSQGASTPAGTVGSAAGEDKTEYWSLGKLKKAYTEYLFNKRAELDEQKESRGYYHGVQWTAEQLKTLKKRRQPAMTFNRCARKIDGIVGLIEKLRQDPKAFARTPQHEQGADLATATIRYVMDASDWTPKSAEAGQDGAVDGIGGIGIEIIKGDKGDPDVGMELVDIQSFFYDPYSYKADFSDAGYMGVGKWFPESKAKRMFPQDKDGNDWNMDGMDYELTSSSEREARWIQGDTPNRRMRIIDCWYEHDDGWCWAIFTGSAILAEGRAFFQDEKGKGICKYIMFSGNVDQDGDRYGFIRNMKSAQDGINARQSKMQHILASKRLFIRQGAAGGDIEKVRAEYARNDGVIMTTGPVNDDVKADDQSFDFAGWAKLLELNLAEIENFGPNPALIGTGVNAKSGRAISLMQQAGMAELGPYIIAYRGWKIRVYRAVWNAIQQHWKAERWIRVTDDNDLAQYIQINGMQTDPMTGMPSMVNPIGSLDVDIILDEGPDTITVMQDMYETLSNVVPSLAPMLSPPEARAMVKMLVSSSPMDASQKKAFNDASQQAEQQGPPPDPKVQQMQMQAQLDAQSQQQSAQLELQKAQAQAQADQQAKQVELAIDAQAQQQKTAAEIEALRIKNEAQIELERQKAEIAAWLEVQKAQIKAQCDQHASELKCAEMEKQSAQKRDEMAASHELELEKGEAKAENDAKVASAKGEAAGVKGESSKGGPIAAAVAALGKQQQEHTRAIIDAMKASATPPSRGMRIIRDAQGRPSHTEPVE